MNEYLSIPGSRWGDANFTDVFTDPTELAKYRDSPLSPRGIRQAERLSSRLSLDGGEGGEDSKIIGEIELIACSPLTRALQTMTIALYPHVWGSDIPIVALPQASERIYLISDLGTSIHELRKKFPIVDFSSEISTEQSETWWVSPPSDEEHSLDTSSSSSSSSSEVEWRPNNEGQTYAEPGETESAFTTRMISLYDWLDARTERTIALICHWGVIEYLTGDDYDNCQMKVVDFNSMKRTGFMISDEEFSEIFKEGERSVIQDVE
jgi:broad specificity phosphatase PhoE